MNKFKWVTIGSLASLFCLVVSNIVPARQVKSDTKATLHSAYKGVGTLTNVAPNRMHWGGIYWGHSFNDSGSGFLHNVVWNCPAAADIANGQVTFKGYCALTDADGDKIFGDWSGGGPATGEILGRVDMTGGTGKYSKIRAAGISNAEVSAPTTSCPANNKRNTNYPDVRPAA